MQQVKKNKSKIDFYLSIYNYIKENNKLPYWDSINLNSKQALNYYVKTLKRKKYIEKVGYGVWQTSKKYDKQVNLKSSRVAFKKNINFNEINSIPINRLKVLLRENNLDCCIFCSNSIYEIHNIIPKRKGGSDSIYNLIPVCPNHHTYVERIGYTSVMKRKLQEYHDIIDTELKRTEVIRGHAFVFRVKIPQIIKWNRRTEYLDNKRMTYSKIKGGQKIIIEGKNIHIFNKSIIIYTKDNFFSKSAHNSNNYAIQSIIELIESVEKLFNVSFKISGKYKFRVCRQHYGKIKDALAKQYNREKKKLNVYNERGLWFLIDNSLNLHEAETVHPKTAREDMDNCIIPFFNSMKDKNGFTADFILESIGTNTEHIKRITQNQDYYAENLKSHVSAIQTLEKAVKKLSEKVDKL